MATKPFIGIKKVWYATPIATVANPTTGLSGAEVAALIAAGTTKEVMNVHNDTWGYEESDPTVEDYINELTGKPYYRDVTQQGVPTISFTMGEYAFDDKAALQGGKADANSWSRGDSAEIIEKCIIAQTKTNNYIVFPKASIIGKGAFVQKNIGLGVTAVPVETGITGLVSEKWFKGEDVIPAG